MDEWSVKAVRKVIWVVGLLVAVLGLTAVPATAAPPLFAKPATVSYQPVDGTAEVLPTDTVSVKVANGAFEKVELVAADGSTASGGFSADRTAWTSDGTLGYGTTYTWRGSARGDNDAATPLGGSFSTITPVRQVGARLNIADDAIVGVAAPIMIQFDGPVADKASVERALRVTTSTPVEGAWGWLPDEPEGARVHWRPREYWPAGTNVRLDANFVGVPFGDGAWGAEHLTSAFAIGPAQVVTADVRTYRMVVRRDGAVVGDYPASYGVDSDPERSTRSGIHVVSEKFESRRMISERFDYDVVMQWAVRMSNNGEFVHANPDTTDVQGRANVSHGCVNLSTSDAKTYYDMVRYGDPIEVSGSGVQLSARDGDIWDWTLSWEQWRALSALSTTS